MTEIILTEALYGTILDLNYHLDFGYTVYIYISLKKNMKSAKIELQSRKCQIIGYDGMAFTKLKIKFNYLSEKIEYLIGFEF